MMSIAVTGANGFVGGALVSRLVFLRHDVRPCVRYGRAIEIAGVKAIAVDQLSATTDWSHALIGVEVLVHTAARVHVMKEKCGDPLSEFRRVNVDATINLARQAAQAGVKRFVFLSSIGVNGAETFGAAYTETDVPAPHSPYATSKYEAELGLGELAAKTGMEVVVLRPPLVYGAGAPGNFGSLLRCLARGVPLPLGAITNNHRSLVVLDNLIDLIVTCLDHPVAANQTFLVSDGEDLSTTQLLQRMGWALGKPARLIRVPCALLKLGAAMMGKPEFAQRLCGSLQVDISKTRQLLGWSPPLSVDEGLKKAAEGYLREASV
jgi:nucleoside-diphosphate-sugar epimerase